MCRGWNHILEEAGREVDFILQMEWWSRYIIPLDSYTTCSSCCGFTSLCFWFPLLKSFEPSNLYQFVLFSEHRKNQVLFETPIDIKNRFKKPLFDKFVGSSPEIDRSPPWLSGWRKLKPSCGKRRQPLTIGRRYRRGGGIDCHLRLI